jgi:hypothetical protein
MRAAGDRLRLSEREQTDTPSALDIRMCNRLVGVWFVDLTR